MTVDAIQSPHLRQLLRRIRNRQWQQNAVARLTTGCYLSAGVALVLVAVHLLVISVPALIWWFAVALPLVGRLPRALVTDRPDSVTSAKFADSWFATRELFTAAQYVNEMPPSRRSDAVPQQIRASAETAATQLLANNAPCPRFSADPRLTIAVLVIALSGLLTLPTATGTTTASQTGTDGLQINKPADAATTSWLVKSTPEAAQVRSDSLRTAADRNRSEHTSDGVDAAGEQRSYESIPGEMLAAADEVLPENAHPTAPRDHNTTSSTRPDDPAVANADTGSAIPLTGPDAEQHSQSRQQLIAGTPVATPTTSVLLEHGALQVTAQAGPQSRSALQPDARPALDDQFSVVAAQSSRPVRVDTTDLAHQQWGPNARTLAARYAQARQP